MTDFATLRPGVRPWGPRPDQIGVDVGDSAGDRTVEVTHDAEGRVAAILARRVENVPLDPEETITSAHPAFHEIKAEMARATQEAQQYIRDAPFLEPAPVASVIEAAPPEPFEIPPVLQQGASFLCGGAGCGKTYLARQIVAHSTGTLLCASTGIAAVNLGEGTTINSALGYFDTPSLVDKFTSGFLTSTLGKLWKAGIRRIILDEVSMLDAEQLTVIAMALDELSGRGYVRDITLDDEIAAGQAAEGEDPDHDGARPWPIKLLLVGDFLQLPPVKAKYAFESPEWHRFGANKLELTTIRRQADAAFIHALRAARRGEAGPVADFFGPKMVTNVATDFPGVTLVGRNEEVDRMNALRMNTLTTPAVEFRKSQWGEPRTDWSKIADPLVLKEGALVMVLANAKDTLRTDPDARHEAKLLYANGDLGTVVSFDGGVPQVRLQRTGTVKAILPITRNHERPMEPGRRKELKAEGKEDRISKDGKFEIIGQVTYVPLRVAYASTVHKSQGLSLDQVQVNSRDGFFKTPGLLYVALSRARTAEGLRLVGTPAGLKQRVVVDPRVKDWV